MTFHGTRQGTNDRGNFGRATSLSVALLSLALAAGLSQACGGDPPTLTSSDVTNIPAGTGSGTALSGSYLVTGGSLTGCHCRTGSCSQFRSGAGGRYVVDQQGGALIVLLQGSDGESTQLSGSVNADQSFKVGGTVVNDDQGPLLIQRAFQLVTGVFEVKNGQPTGFHAGIDLTINLQAPGAVYDCDFAGTTDAMFTGP